ncbi:unnamed protein product [Rotaria magnacalcarata]|nr:unnamed protein product [Rotaria magnacalcarata]
MHYDQLYQFLSNINNDTTKRFTTLIDTLVLRGASTACLMLLNYLEKSSNDNQLFVTMILPSIKQLVIFNAENYSYLSIEPLLTPLAFHKNTLQRLHLVFDRPTSYFSILSWLISSRISIYTIKLEVEKGIPENIFINNKIQINDYLIVTIISFDYIRYYQRIAY